MPAKRPIVVAAEPFDPETYLENILEEVPAYLSLEQAAANATRGIVVRRLLELGVGTGQTTRRLLERHPEAEVVGIDESAAMLEYAARACPSGRFLVGRLQDRLPRGPFDLVVSVLAVHHLSAAGKAVLFKNVATVLTETGRFVLGDLIVPKDPRDVVTEVDGVVDTPSSIDEQLLWLEDAGFYASLAWCERDLAVLVGERRPAAY